MDGGVFGRGRSAGGCVSGERKRESLDHFGSFVHSSFNPTQIHGISLS